MSFLYKLAPYRKAVAAFLTPLILFLGADTVSLDGLWQAVIVAIGTLGTVFTVPNTPVVPEPATIEAPYGVPPVAG